MFDWGDLAFFMALMRTGTIRGAARALGVAPTTVGRRVASLETSLGAQLFVRSDEGFAPTANAHALLARGHGAEEAMTTIERQFSRVTDEVRGTVRISAIESFTAEILAPSMPDLLSRYPCLRVHLQVEPRVVSFARGQVDIAIRLAKPVGQRLVSRRTSRIEMRLYASRGYRRVAGPNVLAENRFIAYDDTYGAIPERQWLRKHGLEESVSLWTASTRALLQATIAGAGIALLPTFFARRHPDLVEVAGPPVPPPRAVYLVTHEDLRKQTAISIVWDHLVAALGQLA